MNRDPQHRDAFLWIQHKLDFSNYQMAVLVWFKAIIIGYYLAGGSSDALRPLPFSRFLLLLQLH